MVPTEEHHDAVFAREEGGLRAGPLDDENPRSPLVEVNPADVYSARMRDDLISPRGDRRPDVYRRTVGGEEF